MIRVPAPGALNGETLRRELAAAGINATEFTLYPDSGELEVAGTTDRAGVQKVLDAHVPPPAPPDPVDVLVAELNRASTNTAKLKALADHLPAAIRSR